MVAIADIGSTLEVTPQDTLWVFTDAKHLEDVDDVSPFRMRVEGVLKENDAIFGVYGPVVGGAPRYQGLIANLLVRLDGSNWTTDRHTQANFKVGRSRAKRVEGFGFGDPRGTDVEGYPVIGRFGWVEVMNAEQDGGANPVPLRGPG